MYIYLIDLFTSYFKFRLAHRLRFLILCMQIVLLRMIIIIIIIIIIIMMMMMMMMMMMIIIILYSPRVCVSAS